MPFKKGDKVIAVQRSMNLIPLEIGKEYEVEQVKDKDKSNIGILQNGVIYWYQEFRFKPAEQLPLKLEIGCIVKVLDTSGIALNPIEEYQVEKLYVDVMGGVTGVKLVGSGTRYHPRRFTVLKAAQALPVPFDAAKWEPKVGEKVYVIDKDQWHAAAMDQFINDGKEYAIRYIDDFDGVVQFKLENCYYYAKSSLRPTWAGKVKQPPNPPKKDVPELREELWQKQEARGDNGLCSFAFENKDGKQSFHTNAPCHAALSGGGYIQGEITKVAYGLRFDIKYKVSKKEQEAHKAFCNYIINQSPWAVAFLTKDIEEAITKDIYMNVEVNRHVMAGACVALRSGQEWQGRAVMFKKLLDWGINPHICFLLSCAFKLKEKENVFAAWGGGHDVLDSSRKLNDLIRFFKEGYFTAQGKEAAPYRTYHAGYTIAAACAGSGNVHALSIGTWLQNNTTQTTKGDGWQRRVIVTDEALKEVAAKLDAMFQQPTEKDKP